LEKCAESWRSSVSISVGEEKMGLCFKINKFIFLMGTKYKLIRAH
jgi:hypothetical protein